MRLRLDCGVVFIVDFSDLSGIRSFSRVLLGFMWVGEWGRSDFGLFYCVFRVERMVGFVLILLGFVRKGVSNGDGVSRLIFGAMSGVELLWVIREI